MYSYYGWVGSNRDISEENSALLHTLATHLRGHGKPYVVGADWNLEPDVLAEFHHATFAAASHRSLGESTCQDHEFDYFLCHALLGGVACLADNRTLGTSPHIGVELTLPKAAVTEMFRIWKPVQAGDIPEKKTWPIDLDDTLVARTSVWAELWAHLNQAWYARAWDAFDELALTWERLAL